MHSQLFSDFDATGNAKTSEQFREDLQLLMELSDDEVSACFEVLPEYRLSRFDWEKDRIVRSLEQAVSRPRAKLHRALRGLGFFLWGQLRSAWRGDTPGQWARDLVDLELLRQEQAASFQHRIEQVLARVSPIVEKEFLRRSAATGVLPSISGCGATVEIRAVQEDRELDGPLEDYQSKVVDVIGIVSVIIRLNRGTPSEFGFQATGEDIDVLIKALQAARADLTALKQYLSLQETD